MPILTKLKINFSNKHDRKKINFTDIKAANVKLPFMFINAAQLKPNT